MATFAKATFNTTRYAASRPHYPQYLYELVFNYHQNGSLPNGRQVSKLPGRRDLAVDLGCGTGQATASLKPFKRVIGVDPSESMIEGAKSYLQGHEDQGTKFELVQSSAEDLSFLQNNSVDLVVGAQAAHWFDWAKIWPEIGRTLRPGGSVAFWVYSEFRLAAYPSLTPLITQYAQGTDAKTSLGPHWQRPGRTILERHLVDVPEPLSILNEQGITEFSFPDKLDRLYFTGSYYSQELPQELTLPIISKVETTWRGLLGYLYTWSSLHNYQERYPEDRSLSFDQGGEGNIAERFWKSLVTGAEKESGRKQNEDDPIVVDWPIALIMTHKL